MINPGITLSQLHDLLPKVDVSDISQMVKMASDKITEMQARQGWVNLAISLLDLTSLNADDEPAAIDLLTQQARENMVAAVCVYPAFIRQCKEALEGTGIHVATVAGMFPHGLSLLEARVADAAACRDAHADEIDLVLPRHLALGEKWGELYHDLKSMIDACRPAHVKIILSTGELASDEMSAKTALVALAAGADFVKTSTGKEAINATLEAGAAMICAMQIYQEATGFKPGLKPAGGIREASHCAAWMCLMEQSFGPDSVHSDRLRIGASGLLQALLKLKE
jgi:deoxyribose-phosphate aldolase